MSRLPTPTPMKDKALAGIAEIRKRVEEAKKDWIAYSKSGEIRLNGAEVQAIGQIEMEALVRLTRSIIMSSVKVPFGNPHYEQFYAVRGNDIIELAGISGASEEEKHKLVARKDIRSHNVIFEFDEAVVLPTTDLPEVGAVAMDTDIIKSDGEAEEGEETMDQDEDAEDSSDSVLSEAHFLEEIRRKRAAEQGAVNVAATVNAAAVSPPTTDGEDLKNRSISAFPAPVTLADNLGGAMESLPHSVRVVNPLARQVNSRQRPRTHASNRTEAFSSKRHQSNIA